MLDLVCRTGNRIASLRKRKPKKTVTCFCLSLTIRRVPSPPCWNLRSLSCVIAMWYDAYSVSRILLAVLSVFVLHAHVCPLLCQALVIETIPENSKIDGEVSHTCLSSCPLLTSQLCGFFLFYVVFVMLPYRLFQGDS